MHEDPARSINPNTLYGCHPLDLRSKFGDHPFHLIIKQPEAPLPKVSSRLRLLEKILNDISRCDLPAKNHFADFMRQRYRRNCKPNTLRSASTGLKQFLFFCQRSGKLHIEQLAREDIEAFTESLQDRGLKPTTVSSQATATRINPFVQKAPIDALQGAGNPLLARKANQQLKLPG